MALIKCNECGNMISDRATKCPKCGCPIGNVGISQEEIIDAEPKKRKGWIWALVVALLCLIGGGGFFAYSHWGNKNSAESENVDSSNSKEDIVELTPKFIKAIEKYAQLGLFSEGMAAACKGEKWGYINTKGEEVIPTTIEAQCVGRFSEGLAFVLTYDGFNVIDKEGKVVFKGKCYFESMHYECEDMPYFINGKLYVPIRDDKGNDFKYAVYDKQGNKIQTTSLAEGEKVYQENRNGKYSIFSEEHRVTEQGNYSTVGLKDSIGKEVLSADYMLINGLASGTTNFSNGVVLVVLSEEIDEDEEYEDKGGIVSEGTRYYYGYADMKGNDSFSAELKERCYESKKTSIIKSEQVSEDDDYVISKDSIILDDENDNYNNSTASHGNLSWIQGNWKCYVDVFGVQKEYRVGISDEYITVFMAGEHYYTGPYRISGEMITYKDNYLLIDFDRHVIMADKSTDMYRF